MSEVSVNVSVDLQSLQPMVKKRRLVQVGTRVALLYLKLDHRVGRLGKCSCTSTVTRDEQPETNCLPACKKGGNSNESPPILEEDSEIKRRYPVVMIPRSTG